MSNDSLFIETSDMINMLKEIMDPIVNRFFNDIATRGADDCNQQRLPISRSNNTLLQDLREIAELG